VKSIIFWLVRDGSMDRYEQNVDQNSWASFGRCSRQRIKLHNISLNDALKDSSLSSNILKIVNNACKLLVYVCEEL